MANKTLVGSAYSASSSTGYIPLDLALSLKRCSVGTLGLIAE